MPCRKRVMRMSRYPYYSTANPCVCEVQLMAVTVAEADILETFHEIDAEINRLLQHIDLLEYLLQKRYPCA